MKKYAILIVLSAAACSGGESTTEPATENVVEATPEVIMAADGKPGAGTYEITQADGSILTEVAATDGTYTTTAADGSVTKGTWRLESPHMWCETEEGSTEEKCFNEEVDAAGVWTSTSTTDPAESSTVVRKE